MSSRAGYKFRKYPGARKSSATERRRRRSTSKLSRRPSKKSFKNYFSSRTSRKKVTRSLGPKLPPKFFKYERAETCTESKAQKKKSFKIKKQDPFHSLNETNPSVRVKQRLSTRLVNKKPRGLKNNDDSLKTVNKNGRGDDSASFNMDYKEHSQFLKDQSRRINLNKKSPQKIVAKKDQPTVNVPKSKINIRKLSNSIATSKIDTLETDFTVHSNRSRINSTHSLQTIFGHQDAH